MSDRKVVIWGHKLEDGHTHSFIHNAFFLAFKHLGFETQWLDDYDYVDSDDCANTIFLTEGQVDRRIPIRKDCKYILHNCNLEKYQEVLPACLNLQVYTRDCLKPERGVELVEPCIYYQDKPVFDPGQAGIENRTLYIPWATNLLPHEFPEIESKRTNAVYWVGSICGGEMGNINELQAFSDVCKTNGIDFKEARLPEGPPTIKAIQISHICPAIQGRWQVEKGYIPCRVFKNISYGRIPGINNPTVLDLFPELPFSKDMEILFHLNVKNESTMKREIVEKIINTVKTKHTYINRIQRLLEVL